MYSNGHSSTNGHRPYNGYQPPPRPPEDTILAAELQIERKFYTITLKENARGRFLRIMEDAAGRRNSVIVPDTGLADFTRVINEMAKAAGKLPASNPPPAEEPGDSIGNR